MTEGLLKNEKPMCVRVWLEVGHACEPRRSPMGRALALDWRVWVRGVSGHDISAFVHKVVFHLHPASAFVYPKRVIQEPPYEIQESGCASIEIPIHVYLKHSSEPRRIRLRYSLRAESDARSSCDSRCVYYDVENPSEPLWRALVRAGGEVVARTDTRGAARDRLVVLASDGEEPAAAAGRRDEARCRGPAAAAGSVGAEVRRQLRAAELSADEAAGVWRLCAAMARYERSAHALPLPPLADPIYRLPEPPASLRALLSSVEADLASH